MQGGPLMHVIAAKAVCFREALRPEFKAYQQQVVANAKALAGALLERGFRPRLGRHRQAPRCCSTCAEAGSPGKEAETLLEEAGITVNKNAVPFDTEQPTITSGIRIGTPAVTTRGMGAAEMRRIADFMADVLDAPTDDGVRARTRAAVRELCLAFPLYR